MIRCWNTRSPTRRTNGENSFALVLSSVTSPRWMSGRLSSVPRVPGQRPLGRDRRDGERELAPSRCCVSSALLSAALRRGALRCDELVASRRRGRRAPARAVAARASPGCGGGCRSLGVAGAAARRGRLDRRTTARLRRRRLRRRRGLGTGIRHAGIHGLVLDRVVAVALEARVLGRAVVDLVRRRDHLPRGGGRRRPASARLRRRASATSSGGSIGGHGAAASAAACSRNDERVQQRRERDRERKGPIGRAARHRCGGL